MAKQKTLKNITNSIVGLWDSVMNFGKWLGARRTLFVWSAFSVAIALFLGVSEASRLYSSGVITNMNTFVLAQFLNMLFVFLKIFIPMFMLVIATKYIFDVSGKVGGTASEAFRLSCLSSIIAGVVVAAFYYLNAGHIIGNNPSNVCASDLVCYFSWAQLWLACKVFLTTFVSFFLVVLGLRSVYSELSFMLARKK